LNELHKRLLWRSRRGMKELDVLLERFVRERYICATESQKCAFAQLLELPDPVMADYLLGHAIPPEAPLRELTRLITAPRL
jgi:antitoxin CptB